MLAKLSKRFHKLVKLAVHSDYRAAFRAARIAPSIEHEQTLKTLSCATVVDIGANRGQFTLVSRHCFPNARIVAFEPLSAPAGRFRAAHNQDAKVTLHQAAIGPQAGEVAIHIAAADDSSSLLSMTDLQKSLYAGSSEVGTEMVQVDRLDRFLSAEDIQPPALLKIDVQGFELSTLHGCGSLLKHFAYLFVECSFVELYEGQAFADEVIAYLRERGFRLRGVYNSHYSPSGEAVQADFLFVPHV